MIFSFRLSEQEHIEIDIHGYAYPASGKYYTDNFLSGDIRIRTGGVL